MQVVIGMIAGATILACGFILGMLYAQRIKPKEQLDPDDKPYSKYRNEDGLLSVRAMKSTTAKGSGKG